MPYTQCWLSYPAIPGAARERFTLSAEKSGVVAKNAAAELARGLRSLYGAEVDETVRDADITMKIDSALGSEEYKLSVSYGKCLITGGGGTGLLYGVFSLLREAQCTGCKWEDLAVDERKAPANDLRMLNHWDNADGSIERGYSGRSFFFKDNALLVDEARLTDYARLLASVGINGTVINNVNVKGAANLLISDRFYSGLSEYCRILAGWGIRLYLSVNFASPIDPGALDTCDPCDPSVIEWWRAKAREVWTALPELGGFLVKADSEGRPGPFTYGRTQAEGANMLADAVAPYGGRIIWRCFVYNCQQDWRDQKTDRARACYDNFMPLDGLFRDNVTLQIKNGPMDFQVREPVSPLIGALKKTHIMVEFQIAQEYTGQQRHVCYLMPWFKEILDTDLRTRPCGSTVASLIRGAGCGMTAVANTGDDENWTGHDLAAANLYGFGRQCFDPSLDCERIADEWLRMTFGQNDPVERTLKRILLKSHATYEKYTAPLGVGWMVNPNYHYGPNVDGYEYSRWGCYHRASFDGIGIDRSPTGSAFCNQYAPPLAKMYADIKTCPEELLLFFHHVPYDYRLKGGETLIQHIYDTHFEGAEDAAKFYDDIVMLKPYLDEAVYKRLEERFAHQKEHACEWRDVINTYFYRKTGIADEKGRTIYS